MDLGSTKIFLFLTHYTWKYCKLFYANMANMMRILRAIEEDTSHIEQGKKEWKEHVLVQKEYMLVLKGFNKWGKKGRYLKTLSHGACDTNKMELSFSVLCFPVATHGHLTSHNISRLPRIDINLDLPWKKQLYYIRYSGSKVSNGIGRILRWRLARRLARRLASRVYP
jgi:hypothetical protein